MGKDKKIMKLIEDLESNNPQNQVKAITELYQVVQKKPDSLLPIIPNCGKLW